MVAMNPAPKSLKGSTMCKLTVGANRERDPVAQDAGKSPFQ